MVEPGVTFGELIPAGQERRTPAQYASAAAEDQIRHRQHAGKRAGNDAQVSMGHFGSAGVCRSVSSAPATNSEPDRLPGPGTVKEQWKVGGVQKAPYGPGTASWHRLIQGAQGTMGIVTWASMRCEILPSLEEPFVVGSSQPRNAARSDFLADPAANGQRMLHPQQHQPGGHLCEEMAGRLSEAQGYPASMDPLSIRSPAMNICRKKESALTSRTSRDITQRLGVEAQKAVGAISANEILKTVQQPSGEPYWKLRYKGACQDVFFLTIHDKLEGQIARDA